MDVCIYVLVHYTYTAQMCVGYCECRCTRHVRAFGVDVCTYVTVCTSISGRQSVRRCGPNPAEAPSIKAGRVTRAAGNGVGSKPGHYINGR